MKYVTRPTYFTRENDTLLDRLMITLVMGKAVEDQIRLFSSLGMIQSTYLFAFQ